MLRDMSSPRKPYRGFRFPAEIIAHAVWLYHCFSLSLRDVELILAARGVTVSYESIRDWGIRFGRQFAATLKRRCQVVERAAGLGGRSCKIMQLKGRGSPLARHETLSLGGSGIHRRR